MIANFILNNLKHAETTGSLWDKMQTEGTAWHCSENGFVKRELGSRGLIGAASIAKTVTMALKGISKIPATALYTLSLGKWDKMKACSLKTSNIKEAEIQLAFMFIHCMNPSYIQNMKEVDDLVTEIETLDDRSTNNQAKLENQFRQKIKINDWLISFLIRSSSSRAHL
jgi:hypothetical protein